MLSSIFRCSAQSPLLHVQSPAFPPGSGHSCPLFSVLSFQLGSDYDDYRTINLHNCTGQDHVSNVTVPNVFDTLPQVNASSGHGWEQWSLFLNGTFPLILRWSQGDPSSLEPSPAHFDVVVVDCNGSTIKTTVVGDLSYTDDAQVKQINIGNNTLTWDSNALWYNVSVNVEGYLLTINSFSATFDTFHPNVALYNGLLDYTGELFGSVPLIRGQVTGSLHTPNKTFTLSGLTVLRHMFSENPLPSYIKTYSAGSFWGYTKTVYDSHLFYRTETTNGEVHEAAFLGRAIPSVENRDGLSSAWATYTMAEDTLYNLSIDTANERINASFSGCANDKGVRYTFRVDTLMLLVELIDLGGGVTTYYSVAGTSSSPFGSIVVNGSVVGFFEEYQPPLGDASRA